MFNNTHYEYKSVDDVIALIRVLYDNAEDLQEDDILDLYPIVMEEIGNIYPMQYYYVAKLEPETSSISLPCNARVIEGVTAGQDPNWCTYLMDKQLVASQVSDNYLTYNIRTGHPKDYLPGKYIDYSYQGDKLLIDEKYKNFYINILYKGEIVDEKGYPMVTQKDAKAIAAYYAYRTALKETRKGIDTKGLMQFYKQEYEIYVAQARVQPLSQNQMNWLKQTATSKDIWRRRRDFKYNR